MKLKKLELHQDTLKNLTHVAEIGKPGRTNNPDCSFIISCPQPCVGDAKLGNR